MGNLATGSTIAMICGGAFAIALGALGAVLIILYFRNKQKAKASQTWPSVKGRIVSTNIRLEEIGDEDTSRMEYIPEVHFEYEVDEMTFKGKRFSFGSEPSFGSAEKARKFLQPYPDGQEVDLFYNPEDPGEAVLSQGMRKMGASLIVGILLVVLMICLLCPISIGLFRTISGA